jgi:hypothetical protein
MLLVCRYLNLARLLLWLRYHKVRLRLFLHAFDK